MNLSFHETKQGGLLGINGPPGTGKTTLLRDIVAGVVAERAAAMCAYDDPETAFAHSGEKLRSGNAWIHLYKLSHTLKGHEMVVASSNNKAVENVSGELPGINAISEELPKLRYFKTSSDAVHGCDTWGAIAAVLGNAQNRVRFKQAFWWDDDHGLNNYLRAASGSAASIQVTNEETGEVEHRLPKIVTQENPPKSREEALRRWEAARKAFSEALDKSRQWTGG